MRGDNGFTLMEILLALLVLSVLSMLLSAGLRTVIDITDRVEQKAKVISEFNSAMLMMYDDVQQASNRPVRNAAGQEVPAFIGSGQDFWLTHQGAADPTGESVQSNLSRCHYVLRGHQLMKEEALVLDQAKESKWPSRVLFNAIEDGRFEYLNKEQRWQREWSAANQNEPLPRAVRFQGRIRGLGGVTQWMLLQSSVVVQ